MDGSLSVEMKKGDKVFTRALHANRNYIAPDGTSVFLLSLIASLAS